MYADPRFWIWQEMTGSPADAEDAVAVDNKRIRKLDRREHDRTRELYEAVFPEDSQLFVDYYYDQVADENEIYVVEKEEEICAMLHLNPYEVHLDGSVYPLHYIVAVGTRQEYRHQGMMKSLLKASLHEMYERKEPFTFLMRQTKRFTDRLGLDIFLNRISGRLFQKNTEDVQPLSAFGQKWQMFQILPGRQSRF